MVKSKETSEWLKELANCEKVIPNEEVSALGKITSIIDNVEENVSSDDEVDEDLEANSQRLNEILGLPSDTYSLTRIMPNLPECMKYSVRSGLTHMNMNKFSSFSRGLQGAAIAIAAYATTELIKVRYWNEPVIDQIIEDGDTYYCESYKQYNTQDRRLLGIDELNKSLNIQKTHKVHVYIDDAAYTGVFNSKNPTEMHLVKALELFFQKYNSGLLTSPSLNISIWRGRKFYNIFDAQGRCDENLLPDDLHGNAKLILLHDLAGVYFIILEKSNVTDEHFVLYPISIGGISRIIEVDPNESGIIIGEPQRRPSGYNIHGLRALIRGTFHLMHESVPEIIRGHAHLIIAIVAIIYSRLIHANKWTTAIIDLIFNQSHIYFVDFVRVIEKKIDDNFNLDIDDLLSDIFLGVYAAKVKIQSNIIPGEGKKGKGKGKGKGKVTLNSGLLEFFEEHQSAILEVKKIFYAVWKDGDKYYFFDPFACDDEGFRVDSTDVELIDKYKYATSCVTMNSTIDEVIETILENTGSTEKDPFILHGAQVLYVKTGSDFQGSSYTVIYREKKTNRRPLPSPLPSFTSEQLDECGIKVDIIPKPRIYSDKCKTEASQYPELMKDINDYMMKDNEFIMDNDEGTEKIVGYKILNPHRIILHGTKNCLDDNIDDGLRGRQGLSIAICAIAQSKLKHPSEWRNFDVDKIIELGNKMHYNLMQHVNSDSINDDEDEEEEDDDDDDEDDDDDDEDDNNNKTIEMNIKKIIDVSMLPNEIKFDDNIIKLKKNKSIAQGDADPIVNLGEALDQYFAKYDELILENKYLMYGIWKINGYYFLFNPYGGDEEGWRLRNYPASFIVTDTINELVDVLYGVIEFNDRKFYIHFLYIESIGSKKFMTTYSSEVPECETERYQTLFLPLTDNDLSILKIETNKVQEKNSRDEKNKVKGEDDKEKMEDGIEDEDVTETDDEEEVEDENIERINVEEKSELTLVDALMEMEEKERLDAPSQLNLFLLTTNTNLVDEVVDTTAKEALEYERLKYNHPPPYVLPPKRVLALLLAAKKASKSISSLVSCFSVDSKLAVKIDFPPNEKDNAPTINNVNGQEKSKIIKLPPRKYLYSRILPIGFTPLRAINEKFIYDEKGDGEQSDEMEKENSQTSQGIYYIEEAPELFEGVRIAPTILPLGPVIKTPLPQKKTKSFMEKKKRRCKLSEVERKNELLDKVVCNTENLLFDMIFPKLPPNNEENEDPETEEEEEEEEEEDEVEEREKLIQSSSDEVLIEEDNYYNTDELINKVKSPPKFVGFHETIGNHRIISANMKLEKRNISEDYHFKICYFAAILCILAKTKIDVNKFRSSLLDELIILANKIYKRTGSLRYKERRSINNIELHGVSFNIIMKQNAYADPENHKPDALPNMLEKYLKKYSSGILVFSNASFAFWCVDDAYYYLFDPYTCDETGRISENGNGCLLEFTNINNLIEKIEQHSGVAINKPYRIHTLFIAHIEELNEQKKLIKLKKIDEKIQNNVENEEIKKPDEIKLILNETESISKRKTPLIELSDWLNEKNKIPYEFNINLPGFAPLININASVLEVVVIKNDITRPILAPFKSIIDTRRKKSQNPRELPRRKPFDRKFNEHSILSEPLDLCIMAWSCVHEPTVWGVRTIRGIYDASQDLAYDSLLSAEDTTVSNMIDGVLNEFDIANYRFHVIFAPLHSGKLYSNEGWNLAMSLKKIFDTPIYTGAFISCGKAHIGVMKIQTNYYAWWSVIETKNLRIITTKIMEDFLKLIIQQIDEIDEIEFKIRVITISYAKKLDPDCSDIKGLHEPTAATSLPQIHRRQAPIYDLEALFRPVIPNAKPIFILGTAALQQYELIKEPRVKRCYFVAILAVMVKRDIMQSLMPSMIDKIMRVAEDLYREFNNPKYHTEHILRNVTVMNRIFDFRDVASPLYKFKENIVTETDDYYLLVKKKLQQHFHKHSHGIIHFTNCCYGFWYSQSTNFYYYFDPYQCNNQGERVLKNGYGCLGIFSSLSQMVESMMLNRAPNTTGFFIHNIHVESINVVPSKKFVEDPMWIYLDYHWCASHAPLNARKRRKKKSSQLNDLDNEGFKSKNRECNSWNHYIIEIPNLIYSIWGTLGAYDRRFGERAGKNHAAIAVAVLAMQHLCHPSKWSAAILDSAVICGDCYYTESLKSAAQRGAKYTNTFNLQPHFKVFPHIWQIEYGAKMYGMLYGGNNRMTLATTLKLAIEKSTNILIECGEITLGVLFADDGYYAIDPCWTGPPLFEQNHGALYVLRCRNLNTLVYALIKMINTNQRLEFTMTPVEFYFKHELCVTANQRNRTMKKRIYSDTIECQPSDVIAPKSLVCGAIAVADNDIYLEYRKKVELGIECGEFLENPPMPSPIPQLNEGIMRNLMISTQWHKNIGQVTRRKRSESPLDSMALQHEHDEKYRNVNAVTQQLSHNSSVEKLFDICDDYPRTIDFLNDKCVVKSMKPLTKRNIEPDLPPSKPLDCLSPREFILRRSAKEFKRQIDDMASDSYKIYKHKIDGDDDDNGNEID
ncbi:hypothetical protein PV328_000515 [Microctonus aethiopoides]|uniref:Uncharacterized protein n=1 Tax=Microctonus aethiopoides TaxID=144406 RepID=A0AA39FVP2_9HYME|nr:hypothetical protein PV328_000515 [Microctonus aethiopoides]